jgi:glycosyltransferase involved in cell wall biosynthesis
VYQRLLYGHLAAHGIEVLEGAHFKAGWLLANRHSVDILHFHWPERYYRRPRLSWLKLGYFGARLVAARLLRYRLAWTIHQVYPHESVNRRLDRLAGRLLAHASHVLFAHDEQTAALARGELGAAARNVNVVPLGSFGGAHPPGRDRKSVRQELGIPPDAFVFLFFGRIRAYKGLETLLTAFASASLPQCALIIAGRPFDEASSEAVKAAAAADPRIKPLLRFIPDSDVAELFEASDAAVLPRSEGGTSGSLVLALSLGVPAIVSRQPAYEELIGQEAAGWLYEAGNAASLRSALERAAAKPDVAVKKRAAAAETMRDRGWFEIAANVAEEMRRAASDRPGGRGRSEDGVKAGLTSDA